MLPEVRCLRRLLDEGGIPAELEMDGGITPETAPRCVEAGARVLVAGTAVFNDRGSVAENMTRLRESATRPTL